MWYISRGDGDYVNNVHPLTIQCQSRPGWHPNHGSNCIYFQGQQGDTPLVAREGKWPLLLTWFLTSVNTQLNSLQMSLCRVSLNSAVHRLCAWPPGKKSSFLGLLFKSPLSFATSALKMTSESPQAYLMGHIWSWLSVSHVMVVQPLRPDLDLKDRLHKEMRDKSTIFCPHMKKKAFFFSLFQGFSHYSAFFCSHSGNLSSYRQQRSNSTGSGLVWVQTQLLAGLTFHWRGDD